MIVSLTSSEVMTAALVGVRRQTSAIFKGLPDKYGLDRDRAWQVHIEGACGELAVAKATGLYWPASVDTFKQEADLGKNIQVRSRTSDHYDLIVRENDSDDHAYVLVTGMAPRLTVRGWYWGRDAKEPKWRASHGGRDVAYFVPSVQLRGISTLKEVAK